MKLNPLLALALAFTASHARSLHAQVDCLSWKKVEGAVSGPAPRIFYNMEYDSIRDRIVLFGGTPYGDIAHPDEATTWEWDGAAWQGKEIAGPPRHEGGSMAFDSKRGVMVLWALGQTWEYDGEAWTLRSTTGPSPSAYDPMCFDSDRNVCVLVTDNKATWEWDGISWSPRSGLGPPTTDYGAIAYDPVRKVCVFNGGLSSVPLNTTWEWDGQNWTLKNTGTAIEGHAMVFSPEHGKLLRYGSAGGVSNPTAELSTWDGTTWTSVPSNGAIPRQYHRMVATPGGLLVFSGRHRIKFGSTSGSLLRPELSQFHNGLWESLSAGNPGPRASAALAYNPTDSRVYMTGGDCDSGRHEGAWVFDGTTWQLLTSGPMDYFTNAGLAFDTDRSRMVLQTAANSGSGSATSSTYEWIDTQWVLVTTGASFDTPYVDTDAMGYDPGLKTVVAVDSPSVFRYDGATWNLRAQYPPGSCSNADFPSLLYDPTSGMSIIFSCSQLDIWNGTVAQVLSTLPSTPRTRTTLREFPPLGGCILFGGADPITGHSLDSLWFWSVQAVGVTWQQVSAPGPGARSRMGSAFDSTRGVMVAYGGQRHNSIPPKTTQFLDGTWELSTDTGITQNPQPLSVQSGSTAQFGVNAFGAQLQYQWQLDGVPLTDGPRITGSQTATLTIDPVIAADAGEYDVVITSPCGGLTSQPAALSVNCYADCNADGSLDIFDYFCFGNAFGGNQPYADCNADGLHDVFDFLCFQNAFAGGCP